MLLYFVIDTLSGEFEKIKTYMLHKIGTGKGQWMRAVNQYRSLFDISWEELKNMGKKEFKIKIRECDTEM